MVNYLPTGKTAPQRGTYQWSDRPLDSASMTTDPARSYHHGQLERAGIDGTVEEVETVELRQ